MGKKDQIFGKIQSLLSGLSDLLDEMPKKKYLTMICQNYLQFIIENLQTHYLQGSETLLSSILDKFKVISCLFDDLDSSQFFKNYGLYQKNEALVEKMTNNINELMKISQSLCEKKAGLFPKIILDKKVRLALDQAVEDCTSKVNEIKNQEKKSSEFKKNIQEIDDELTYIFWFQTLADEALIDDKEYLTHLARVLANLGKDIKRMNRDRLLDEVDRNRTNAISPSDVNEFFRFGLTHPQAVAYDLAEIIEDTESDDEKTLKRVRKPKVEQKNIEPKEGGPAKQAFANKNQNKNENKNEEENKEDGKKKVPRGDSNKKANFSPNEEKNQGKNDKPGRASDPDENNPEPKTIPTKWGRKSKHRRDQDKEALVLTLVEVDEANPGDFELNSKLIIKRKHFILNGKQATLQTKYVAKFGRQSKRELYHSDIKFSRKNSYISRRQFQILSNDLTSDAFQIVCTSPSDRTETSFKVSDHPLKLREDSMILLNEFEVFQVEFLDGNSMKPNKEEDDDDPSGIEARKRRKKSNSLKEREKNKELLRAKTKNQPFIQLDGVCSKSEYFGKKILIKSSAFSDGFQFGRDLKFTKEPSANSEATIFFRESEGWFIKSHSLTDKKFKIHKTLVNVKLFDQVQNAKNSDPIDLETGMIIHICGFSFRVE